MKLRKRLNRYFTIFTNQLFVSFCDAKHNTVAWQN